MLISVAPGTEKWLLWAKRQHARLTKYVLPSMPAQHKLDKNYTPESGTLVRIRAGRDSDNWIIITGGEQPFHCPSIVPLRHSSGQHEDDFSTGIVYTFDDVQVYTQLATNGPTTYYGENKIVIGGYTLAPLIPDPIPFDFNLLNPLIKLNVNKTKFLLTYTNIKNDVSGGYTFRTIAWLIEIHRHGSSPPTLTRTNLTLDSFVSHTVAINSTGAGANYTTDILRTFNLNTPMGYSFVPDGSAGSMNLLVDLRQTGHTDYVARDSFSLEPSCGTGQTIAMAPPNHLFLLSPVTTLTNAMERFQIKFPNGAIRNIMEPASFTSTQSLIPCAQEHQGVVFMRTIGNGPMPISFELSCSDAEVPVVTYRLVTLEKADSFNFFGGSIAVNGDMSYSVPFFFRVNYRYTKREQHIRMSPTKKEVLADIITEVPYHNGIDFTGTEIKTAGFLDHAFRLAPEIWTPRAFPTPRAGVFSMPAFDDYKVFVGNHGVIIPDFMNIEFPSPVAHPSYYMQGITPVFSVIRAPFSNYGYGEHRVGDLPLTPINYTAAINDTPYLYGAGSSDIPEDQLIRFGLGSADIHR